jgi:hypothetical protein
MKKLFTLVTVFLLGLALLVQAQNDPKKKKDGPELTFKEDSHDFGKIVEGLVAEYDFYFTNTGNLPLTLVDVRPSCGCTSPEWSREPIAPGKTGFIKVKYNSAGRPGPFNKSITITTNIPNETKALFIKGEVIASKDKTQDPNLSPVRTGN